MRLAGKRLLMLVSDGVDLEDYRQLRKGFEAEHAALFVTAPNEYGSVETCSGSGRGEDIQIDIPLEAIDVKHFEGVIIPDGVAGVDALCRSKQAVGLVRAFHERSKSVFACGYALELLRTCGVISTQVLVREDQSVYAFVDQAVGILQETPFRLYAAYRSTMKA